MNKDSFDSTRLARNRARTRHARELTGAAQPVQLDCRLVIAVTVLEREEVAATAPKFGSIPFSIPLLPRLLILERMGGLKDTV